MRKRSSKPKFTREVNVMASRIVQSIADLDIGNKNPAAVALGRLGGQRGGRARADKLSAEQRHEIARKAALARWQQGGKE